MIEFTPWPKIARLNRDIVVTEKIDGTNAAVGVLEDGTVYAQSRSRIITPEEDNFGFARWVQDNSEDLSILGPGVHFGEWWGSGIQRGYDLPKGEKRFSLFNTSRWASITDRPKCCFVVPILYQGPFEELVVKNWVESLRSNGSWASPGFMKPEGVVVFHTHANMMFKVTLEKDEMSKGEVKARGLSV